MPPRTVTRDTEYHGVQMKEGERVLHTERVYGKIVRHTSKLSAHDEANDARLGDTVRIMETRPLSKLKRWRLVEVIQK